jgi:DNA-binding MarR family transcriptional regulator
MSKHIFKGFLMGCFMRKTLMEDQFGQALSGSFAMLQALREQEPRISVAEVQAVIAVAMSTLRSRTNVATVRDVADKLGLSTSGASRVLASLSDPDGLALVSSDRGIQGTRAEAFVLTDKGRALVAGMLAAMKNQPRGDFEAHTFETYAEARWIKKRETTTLRRISWDEDAQTLVVAPYEAAASKEIREWAAKFLSKEPKFERTDDGAAALTFSTVTDAVYFTLRWC